MKTCHAGEHCRTPGVTDAAIRIDVSRAEGPRQGAFVSGFVLVIMMADMVCGGAGFVLAIGAHRRPGELEWQEDE